MNTEALVESEIITGKWAEKLSPFIESEEFDSITAKIKSEKMMGIEIYPKTKDMFKAFNLCPFDKLSVAMAAQDPYHQPGVADGLAFSCGYSEGYLQPSLRHILSEINRTTGKNVHPLDLSYLAKQGVLLINKSLSVRRGTPNSHQGLWDKFHEFLFEKIINKKEGPMIYILLGKDALWFAKFARMGDIILTAKHPASAAYSGGEWDCEDVFNRCNTHLSLNNYSEIKW